MCSTPKQPASRSPAPIWLLDSSRAHRQVGTDRSGRAAVPPIPLWESVVVVVVGAGAGRTLGQRTSKTAPILRTESVARSTESADRCHPPPSPDAALGRTSARNATTTARGSLPMRGAPSAGRVGGCRRARESCSADGSGGQPEELASDRRPTRVRLPSLPACALHALAPLERIRTGATGRAAAVRPHPAARAVGGRGRQTQLVRAEQGAGASCARGSFGRPAALGSPARTHPPRPIRSAVKDDDRRPFPTRHPAITAGIVFSTLLGLLSLLMLFVYVRKAYPFNGPRFAIQINTWGTLACASPACLMVLLILAARRTLGKPPDWMCAYCGYDRRGVPDLSPCPECGRPTWNPPG